MNLWSVPLTIVGTDLLSLRKKAGKEPFNNWFVRTIFNAVGEGLAPPAAVFRRKLGKELASLVCTYFTYTVIPSEAEQSPYEQNLYKWRFLDSASFGRSTRNDHLILFVHYL